MRHVLVLSLSELSELSELPFEYSKILKFFNIQTLSPAPQTPTAPLLSPPIPAPLRILHAAAYIRESAAAYPLSHIRSHRGYTPARRHV